MQLCYHHMWLFATLWEKKIHKVLVYNKSVLLHVHVWMMNFMVFLYVQIFATGFVPYLGKALNFLLLSWIYAYYCFEYVVHLHFFFFFFPLTCSICHYDIDTNCAFGFARYKWNQSAIDLDKRLNFFESNWAFFAGFGKVSF